MFKRILPLCMMSLLFTSCTLMDDPVDEQLLQHLKGSWQQTDGRASLVFYDDQTVKLSMPDERPPLRLLTTVENNKDHGIGFSVGDRWSGPVYVLLAEDGHSLQLKFPPSDPEKDNGRVVSFRPAP